MMFRTVTIPGYCIQQPGDFYVEPGQPDMFVDKVHIDGLCGLTDEDNLGFTYAVLDRYIREGVCDDAETKARIDRMHEMNLFKLQPMPTFRYEPEK